MGTTWGQIKLATLKKMDPAVTNLIPNRNTKDYLNAIVPVANRGLQDLSTAGKFIVKDLDITIPEVTNELGDNFEIQQHINSDIEFEPRIAKAYYFEISGRGTAEIYVGNTLVNTITNTSKDGFTAYKGKIDNIDEDVRLVLKGAYPYLYRNVALYNVEFEEDKDVWVYSRKRRFNLKELVDDFFKLVSQDVVLESNADAYLKFEDYDWEGDSTLVLNGTKQGTYKIHYYAYPQMITDNTPDDYELSLDPEVASLLPLYMAAELFEDDDLNQAYYFREQYVEAKQTLMPSVVMGRPQFVDRWGW